MASWGPIKTCKTTLGLFFPQPSVLFDFDLGFERALPRLPTHCKYLVIPANIALQPQHLTLADIIVKKYQIPIKFPRKPVKGILDLWDNQVKPDIILAAESPNIKSIILDTGTVWWSMDTAAQLERVQQKSPDRVNLQQIEYSIPNQDARALLGYIRQCGKHLYMPHHVGGIYQDIETRYGKESIKIGETWDGFSHLGAIVDVIGRTYIETVNGKKKPHIMVETCGYTLDIEGMFLVEPTFDVLLSEINRIRASENGHLENL